MPDMNEIKKKVMDTIGTVADATKDVASKTADMAKSTARVAKLSVDINSERDTLKKAYQEIGKLYYDEAKNAPTGIFAQLFDEVGLALEKIEEYESEISDIKSHGSDDDGIEVEFEEVVAEEECSCGCSEHTHGDDEKCDCGCDEHKH